MLDSEKSAATLASWASAPARLGDPRCFLPRTRFLRPSRQHITAAELRGNGMDSVLGPGDCEVKVIKVTKHAAEARTMVSIQTKSASHRFTVTGDHLLIVEGAASKHQEVSARDLVELGAGRLPRVFDGQHFQDIVAVKQCVMTTEVVEITFENDGVVLAWLLPERRPHGRQRQLRPAAAVACLGSPPRTLDRMLECGYDTRRTFIDAKNDNLASKGARAARRRSISADGRPVGVGWFSRGSKSHCDSDPERCKVCEVHQRHLMDPSLPRCEFGTECNWCHMPHPERGWRSKRNSRAHAPLDDSMLAASSKD